MSRPLQTCPWRSLLFVPGADPHKLERAAGAGADGLIYDLEDAVAPQQKEAARRLVVEALAAPRSGAAALRLVRVNALDTPHAQEDLAAAVQGGADGVVLPKCESATQLAQAQALMRRHGAPVSIIALIETPAGVLDLAELSRADAALAGLGFGHADFCRAMGLAELRADAGMALQARGQVVLAARARGLIALDAVCLAVRDDAAFVADAELGRRLGYDGKLCLHPAQVPLANRVFSPDAASVARAQRLLAAYAEALARGQGTITVDGEMVDAPVAAAQRQLLERARRTGVL